MVNDSEVETVFQQHITKFLAIWRHDAAFHENFVVVQVYGT
jgi:hypothetical protein